MVVQKHVSNFQLMMALQSGRPVNVIDFSEREAGLYVSGWSNPFNTSLLARGPREELEKLVDEATSS